jgi:serine/threonine-protein phosphatase PP1 catalytic subunit
MAASPFGLCIDAVISRLVCRQKDPDVPILTEPELIWLCKRAKQIFKSQPGFLELAPPITICGDVHGQFSDLVKIFEPPRTPDLTNYLFLGDYVDRGPSNLNTISLLFAYKVKYPRNFFLLRGNHECSQSNRQYGFFDECGRAFPDSDIWGRFNECFAWLPVAALVDGRIFCVHGGLSPELAHIRQFKKVRRPNDGRAGLVGDLLWSDPDPAIDAWGPSPRGVGCTFGGAAVKKFLRDNDLDIIVRAHQFAPNGYDFPFYPATDLVTVFSAPGYCGVDNKGAMLHVNENLRLSFSTLTSGQRC